MVSSGPVSQAPVKRSVSGYAAVGAMVLSAATSALVLAICMLGSAPPITFVMVTQNC